MFGLYTWLLFLDWPLYHYVMFFFVSFCLKVCFVWILLHVFPLPSPLPHQRSSNLFAWNILSIPSLSVSVWLSIQSKFLLSLCPMRSCTVTGGGVAVPAACLLLFLPLGAWAPAPAAPRRTTAGQRRHEAHSGPYLGGTWPRSWHQHPSNAHAISFLLVVESAQGSAGTLQCAGERSRRGKEQSGSTRN